MQIAAEPNPDIRSWVPDALSEIRQTSSNGRQTQPDTEIAPHNNTIGPCGKYIAPQSVLVVSARACRTEEAISTSSLTASASAATTFLRFGDGFAGFFRAAAGRSSAELVSSTSASDLRLEPELAYIVGTGPTWRRMERPSRLLL